MNNFTKMQSKQAKYIADFIQSKQNVYVNTKKVSFLYL